MRVCSLYEIEKENFYISDISSMQQCPEYKTLTVKYRSFNGFILIESGEGVYTWKDGMTKMYPGSLIYLPEGSEHILKITSEKMTLSRVDFTITDKNGENIIFSHSPILISKHQNIIITDLIHNLNSLFGDAGSNFKRMALLNELFDIIKRLSDFGNKRSIQPVIDYIESHYTEKLDCKALSDMCFMSPAQMYRQFKKETGETPISFRNGLRTERAKLMFLDTSLSISDIASVLGFENVFYFSRMFKNITGISPSKFRATALPKPGQLSSRS